MLDNRHGHGSITDPGQIGTVRKPIALLSGASHNISFC
jgi:hypothetical protein